MLAERVSAALEQAERIIAARERLEHALAELETAVAAPPVAKPNGRADLPERVCANERCDRTFVPRGRQRYCSTKCAKATCERMRAAKRREAEAEAPFRG
jgi:hypothetical protein